MDAGELLRDAARLVSTQLWLALGTLDPSGAPSVTYVPFAPVNGAFGIVVSRLAAHTVDLLARRPASVLLVDTNAERSDAYARARISIGITASRNPGGTAEADAIWEALDARQGETVRILRTLPDFEAISLTPLRARLVLGFASAHDLDAAALAEMMRSIA